MALKTNATMTLRRYVTEDGGYRLYWISPDPGAGEVSEYTIFVSFEEWAAANTNALRLTLARDKFNQKYRPNSTLDGFINTSIQV